MLIRPCLAAATAVMLAGAAPAALTPEQSIAAGGLRSAAEAGTDPTRAAYSASGLARWARVLPTLFPTGTGEGETKAFTQARPVIWSDRATFEAAAARYATAADKVVQVAK